MERAKAKEATPLAELGTPAAVNDDKICSSEAHRFVGLESFFCSNSNQSKNGSMEK